MVGFLIIHKFDRSMQSTVRDDDEGGTDTAPIELTSGVSASDGCDDEGEGEEAHTDMGELEGGEARSVDGYPDSEAAIDVSSAHGVGA
jgi:hypothetical protein